jgi:hypothetical protein
VEAAVEQRILELRRSLREHSILGEYGAKAIEMALKAENAAAVPSLASINRVLSRHGAQDGARRQRRPAPPRGWYLPAVATGEAELDCFDLIEELKIAEGPLLSVLTGTSLHGGLVDAWPLEQATAKLVFERLIERWRRDGLPVYAQFDNGTHFQGTHRWPDAIGRISRLCLALGITAVFAPPREPGFQNAIESFNGLGRRRSGNAIGSKTSPSSKPLRHLMWLPTAPETLCVGNTLRRVGRFPNASSPICMPRLVER